MVIRGVEEYLWSETICAEDVMSVLYTFDGFLLRSQSHGLKSYLHLDCMTCPPQAHLKAEFHLKEASFMFSGSAPECRQMPGEGAVGGFSSKAHS